jgi:hypothetical protein
MEGQVSCHGQTAGKVSKTSPFRRNRGKRLSSTEDKVLGVQSRRAPWQGPGKGGVLVHRGAPLVFFVSLLFSPSCAHRGIGLDDASPPVVTLEIFNDNVIHFTPDDPARYDTVQVEASGDGRVINRFMELRRPERQVRVVARVATRPIPKDIQTVHDKWDRAGNVRLSCPGRPDVEIVKFVTAYGGETEHEVDVSSLAPLLDGPCTFKGFVDTWSSPGWKMDFTLTLDSRGRRPAAGWAWPLFYEEALTEESLRQDPVSVDIDIPDGVKDVVLHYFVSGHCTDGRGADEFEPKDNVILVDGREAHRFRPWRDDCLRFRAINPYCRRWSDGSWSSDYSRSGWCPGDKVLPVPIDLGEHLTPGHHTIEVNIENVRPKDAEDNFGYWRVSAYLVGRLH